MQPVESQESVEVADIEAAEVEVQDSESEDGLDTHSSSDSDHELPDRLFKITAKAKFFNDKRKLRRFLRRNLLNVDQFDRIECFGNSYGLRACKLISEIINEKASDDLYYVDFNNMFVTR